MLLQPEVTVEMCQKVHAEMKNQAQAFLIWYITNIPQKKDKRENKL
jgi:hypothetical protein